MSATSRLVVAVAVGLTALATACSGASNSGGATTCKDFLAKSTADQEATVAKMLKERNGSNSSTGDVVDARVKVIGLCKPADKAGSKIGDLG